MIQYRIRTPRDGDTAVPACDSTDIIRERAGCKLPVSLAAGEFVNVLSAGAQSLSEASY
jgi:ornithine decarboxylase